jgi:glycogen(starch) synthase
MSDRYRQRLLMTADTVGGVFSYALELTRALEPYGFKVELATMGRPVSRSQWSSVAGVPNVTVHESQFRLEWMKDPWDDVSWAGEWLIGLERMVRPDLVHLNQYAFGALAWSAPVLVVAHSCVLSWWKSVHGVEAPEDEWHRYREVVTRGLAGANKIVTPTRAMYASLSYHYGSEGMRACVIYNGVDRPQRPKVFERQPLVVAAGRVWDEAKNLDALISAASSLDWPLIVAGETAPPDGQGQAPKSATLVGPLPRDDLFSLLEQASIYALPARYEPFGLSVLEAAHAGCALVLGDIPSLRELWEGAAAFVNPRDVGEIIRGINSLARDTARRNALASAARARATHYTAQNSAKHYFDLYQTLCSKEPRACA